jgi:23S rRNA (uracil1939-C5)-methyltransferase
MHLKKGTEIIVQIKHLNISGRGVAETEIEGQPYFVAVEKVFPGDTAKVAIKKIKKNYLEASLVELVEKSPQRIPAKSDHAEICGTSPWEVLNYDYQLEIKQKEVERILANINQDQTEIKPIIPSQDIWFYRNKMQYSFGYDANMQKVLGLHISGRRFDIFDVKNCHLAESWFNQVLQFFRQEIYQTDLVPFSYANGQGDLRNLTFRVGKNTNQAMLILTVAPTANLELLKPILQKATKQFSQINSWYIEIINAKRGTPTTTELIHFSGQTEIQETLTVNQRQFTFNIAPDTFFQPNTNTAAKIYQQVSDLMQPDQNQIVYDLFCGTGTIGLTVAPQVKNVYGLDIVESSIQKAQQNLIENNISNATYIAEDAFKPDKSLSWPKPDVVIVDPPRAGLSPDLVKYIVELQPSKIIYVSCNLKSFCQDVLEFNKYGKKLVSLTPIDQFPHTKHLEVVSQIE